jgi:HlyD family secretion protein
MNAKKIAIIAAIVIALGAIVGFTITQGQRNLVAVQTAKAASQDLSSVVTASGEIKAKTYVNVGANAMGQITHLYVKEGDHVKRGQVVAQLDNIQSTASLAASRANLQVATTDASAADESLRNAQADLKRVQADIERTKLDADRAAELYKAQLIPKSQYDTARTTYESTAAGLSLAQTRIAQLRAMRDSSQKRIAQASADVRRVGDIVSKTVYTAPFDGLVTNLPVREGETVVMGIQNSPGSTLMTISDMSIVTVEVMVDETDIVNVKMNQSAEVTIDALGPKQSFKGHVTEIGENAILRSTGVSTSQSNTGSQEAKDFKVVVTLDNPPGNLRPGLSSTAKITTASKSSVLSIPVQALTVRKKSDLDTSEQKRRKKSTTTAAAASKPSDDPEITGVFVVRNHKAEFVPVETGITGTTTIEVTKGLKDGDEVVTGSYRVLRTLRNGAGVKVDNSIARKDETSS